MNGAKPETGELLALACKALSEKYSDDPSAPGILISHVVQEVQGAPIEAHTSLNGFPMYSVTYSEPTKKPAWYLAVHRYKGSFGADRVVAHKVYDEDLDVALTKLLKLAAPKTEAQRKLAAALKVVG